MNNYNVKLYTYANETQQMRIYKRPVLTGISVANAVEKRKATMADSSRVRTQKDMDRSDMTSLKNTKHKIYEVARSNNWQYFITFTFNPQKVMSHNYDEVVRVMHDWLKQVKKEKAPDMVYLVVPELHADKKKYHFHGLISNTGKMRFVDSGHRVNDSIIYNMPDFPFGFTTATAVNDNNKICSYITKYITKELCAVTKGRKRYWVSRNAKRPTVTEYNLPFDEIEGIKDSLEYNIDYVKTVDIPVAYQSIQYLEIRG